MRKPTSGEVRDNFLNAKTVECISDRATYDIEGRYDYDFQYDDSIWVNTKKGEEVLLWSAKKGYAKILSYKTPRFEITKETILKYNMKDEFPEVFKVKLEAGKWYKNPSNKSSMFFKEIKGNEVFGYGFNNTGLWNDELNFYTNYWREATTEEVKEALISEAKKRGIIFNSHIKPIKDEFNSSISELIEVGSEYTFEYGKLYVRGYGLYCVFKDGKWAEIIPTITKAEAERKLNAKII